MDKLLNRLTEAFGVSGHEDDIRKVIMEEVVNSGYEPKEDKMGNVIVKAGSGGERLMLCAHMDQIGIITTYIEGNGFVRIGSIGDYKASEIVHRYVKFENGTIGKIGASTIEPDFGDLFLDLGVASREQALEKVREGDVACLLEKSLELNGCIVGPNLNNRVGCYILLRLIRELKAVNKEIYFVFSAQQELGGRGARAAAYGIDPETCIVVDVHESGDAVGGDNRIKIGNGPVISIMNRNLIIHQDVKAMLDRAAQALNIKVQYGISSEETDGGTIHKERGGIKTGLLSVPCRYKHTVTEMVCENDIEQVYNLLKEVLK